MHTIEVLHDHIVSPQHQLLLRFLQFFSETFFWQSLPVPASCILVHPGLGYGESPYSSTICPSSSIPSDYCSNVYGEVVPMEKNIIIAHYSCDHHSLLPP